MTARFGKQGGVIALGLVVIGARQIDDLRAPEPSEKLRTRQIVAGRNDLVRRIRVGKVARLIDEDHPTVHDARLWGRAGSRDSVCMMANGRGP